MSDKNPYKKGGMFDGASFSLFEKAKQLRKKMTFAEEILWMQLREKVGGYKFRRQHPIGNYIADFFCFRLKLIIELDGSIHNKEEIKRNDSIKQNDLNKLGYTIIRFTNNEVISRSELVLDKISEIVNNILKNGSPVNGI